MEKEYTIREEGYVFMFVSNENPTLVEVYFDDVSMTLTKGNLIQYNEYYPFGQQTANSWTRENTMGNNFLANGGTELNKTSNLYDLDYRQYDQVLGRMNGVDPMTTKYASLTPYNFSFNDPVTFTDVSGADPDDDWLGAHRELEAWFNNTMPSTYMDPGGGGSYGSGGYYGSVMGGYGLMAGRYSVPMAGWGMGDGSIQRTGDTWTIHWDKLGAYGGSWNWGRGSHVFGSESEAYDAAAESLNANGGWAHTKVGNLPRDGDEKKLAQINSNGDYVQVDSKGRLWVPRTEVSYWVYLMLQASTGLKYPLLLGNQTPNQSANDKGSGTYNSADLKVEWTIGLQGGLKIAGYGLQVNIVNLVFYSDDPDNDKPGLYTVSNSVSFNGWVLGGGFSQSQELNSRYASRNYRQTMEGTSLGATVYRQVGPGATDKLGFEKAPLFEFAGLIGIKVWK